MFPAIRQREIRQTKKQMNFGIRTGIKRNCIFVSEALPQGEYTQPQGWCKDG